MEIIKTYKKCCTCAHWCGQRKLTTGRKTVEIDSEAKGECAGGYWNRNQTHALKDGCSTYKKWAALD